MSKNMLGREVNREEIVRFRESLRTTTASELVNSDITLIEAYFDYLLERVEKMENAIRGLLSYLEDDFDATRESLQETVDYARSLLEAGK